MSEGRRRERPVSSRCQNSEDYGEYGEYAETDPTGRYGRFDEMLGKGAMKTVYRAFDEVDGVEVAWNQAKIYDVMRSPEALQRLYSEVHLLSTLHHDSIISFHTSWVDGGKRTFNFITEMFTSGTLREYRQRYRRVDIRAVKNWARQILHGLVYLHGHDPPVIHRDLKCDNIFVNGHLGQVKIGDLGLAAILRGSQAAHSVIGTPEFMAPELYDEVYNELVDIYSFGMCVLEMLTGEYPYNECSNPAQIYRKVTLGKLPDSFYRVKDPEARRFIGRCLEHDASKRSPAKELLLDPFLLFLHGSDPPAMLISGNTRHSCSQPRSSQRAKQSPDMKITGKINSEDDTIILKVQITDKQGEAQNIYFPFDVVSDSPMDVATEMVRELEITYRDPSQIAEMIAREVSALVPDWKDPETGEGQQQSYVYGDEDDSHPFHELSSSTSTQGSMSYSLPSHHTGVPQPLWTKDFEDDDDDDDDASSRSSTNSGRYSFENWISSMVPETELESQGREPQLHRATRFCPEEVPRLDHCAVKKRDPWPESPRGSGRCGKEPEPRRLARNRSLVDMRSQLLHRALVEEVNKRMFKTVGSVENIGFQTPGEISHKGTSRCGRNSGLTWGRG